MQSLYFHANIKALGKSNLNVYPGGMSMSNIWKCPRCSTINNKPDYVIRLTRVRESLGSLEIGTSAEAPPRCSGCGFEADANTMLEGKYDAHGEDAAKKQVDGTVAGPPGKSAKTNRTVRIIVAGIAALVVLCLCILVIGGGIYLLIRNLPAFN